MKFSKRKKIKLNYIIKSNLNSFNIKSYYEYNYFINTTIVRIIKYTQLNEY